MAKILVINSGSSSIKFQILEMPLEAILISGMVERVGMQDGAIHWKVGDKSFSETTQINNHEVGFYKIAEKILADKLIIQSTSDINIVAHRVVHGGNSFTEPTVINQLVKEKIKDLFSLAPLHNPANLTGIELCEKIFNTAYHVAIFDTAFHQSIPEKAHRYALPKKMYSEEKIRVYGFHGTSHKYITDKVFQQFPLNSSKIISIHLGNGCSISAIKNGQCIDTSLGFGPMSGLIMGTRIGDIDTSAVLYLMGKYGYNTNQLNDLLNKQCGMYGLTGMSDLRDIELEAGHGNKDCQMALDMNAYRVQKYIGAYIAALNGLDCLIFTAGIGENSSLLREMICNDMDYLGIQIDQQKNNERIDGIREIQSPHSRIKIIIIPTNEELEIAKQSYNLMLYKI